MPGKVASRGDGGDVDDDDDAEIRTVTAKRGEGVGKSIGWKRPRTLSKQIVVE